MLLRGTGWTLFASPLTLGTGVGLLALASRADRLAPFLGLVAGGLLLAVMAAAETRVVRRTGGGLVVYGLRGRTPLGPPAPTLELDVHYRPNGYCAVALRLVSPTGAPTTIGRVVAVGYPRAARRARAAARRVAQALDLSWSEAGLEAPELEAELQARSRSTFRIVVFGLVALLGLGLLLGALAFRQWR